MEECFQHLLLSQDGERFVKEERRRWSYVHHPFYGATALAASSWLSMRV